MAMNATIPTEADRQREDRIESLSRMVKEAYAAGDKLETRRLFNEFRTEVLARSPEQVARLEAELHERILGGDR